MEYAGDALKTIISHTIDPAGRQLGYILCYKSNIDELNSDMKSLVDAKVRLQHRVEEATLKGERTESDVRRWLSEAETHTGNARKLIEGKRKASCFYFIPNPVARHQLGRKAKKEALTIRGHCEKGNFEQKQISYHDAQATGAAAAAPSPSESAQLLVPLESRALIVTKIMEALEDNNVRRIGVHGMGGVGKTTLLDEVERKAKESNKFNEVIRKLISKNPNVGVIGAEISHILGMLDKKDDGRGSAEKDGRGSAEQNGRGSAEQDGRGSGKKKAFIILDDLWEELHLKRIGIEDSYENVEVKLLLTSRKQDLLAEKMDCRPNLHLPHLSPEETAKLFAAIAGNEFRDPKTDTLAAKLVDKCGGLPILILPLARMLKNEAFSTLKEAVEHINKSEAAYSTLELSYQSLEEEKYKELFLLCGLMGNQNIPVRNLLKYSIGLGSFGGTNVVERARREMVESLRKLKASSLLLQGDDNDHVKIHDVVREFSTKIANKDGGHLVFSTFISHAGDYANAQGDDFNAQNSISKGNRFKVPNFFFKGMRKLRVLDIRSENFTSLPPSVRLLQNLTTLCLDNCVIEDISIIGKLKGLQVLSFMGSEIEHLPKELGGLTNLVLLDLSKCSKLKVIEQGVLERLTKLEDLYLEESFDQWEGEGDAVQVNARLAELNNLPQLRTLDVHIVDPMLLHQDLPFGTLERYRILVGKWDWSGTYEELRTMKLEVVRSDVLSQQWLQTL
ncbi:probable disease resistance protein At4g27220 [Punica granatum]|uniref:Probable disease resistance protein At4g27220 n=1 Tax=Punica granatum TaxID=22663 RepID=A0A6P8C703_PUNGR|nr:probable disease resistance protein At4g27220 [Punica granatum]XP_031377502.1 probable disease resistance protein At4g27220 [Punica granatum]